MLPPDEVNYGCCQAPSTLKLSAGKDEKRIAGTNIVS